MNYFNNFYQYYSEGEETDNVSSSSNSSNSQATIPSEDAMITRKRKSWKLKEDLNLLTVLIMNRELLLKSEYCNKPRCKFWLKISEFLNRNFKMNRNMRQCRDRFNILYLKSIRLRNLSKLKTDSKLNRLLIKVHEFFIIDGNNNISLNLKSQEHSESIKGDYDEYVVDKGDDEDDRKDAFTPEHKELSIKNEIIDLLKSQINQFNDKFHELNEIIRNQQIQIDSIVHDLNFEKNSVDILF